MDEDWRNTFRILMQPLGVWPPKDPKSILYKHSHVAYRIEEYSSAKMLPRGHVWGSLELKSSFWIITQLLLGFLSLSLETVTGNSPMDEDWRNAFPEF